MCVCMSIIFNQRQKVEFNCYTHIATDISNNVCVYVCVWASVCMCEVTKLIEVIFYGPFPHFLSQCL